MTETCRWCGKGEYRDIVKPANPKEKWAGVRPDSVSRFGLTETSYQWTWKHCVMCGHVAMFLHK